MVSKIALLASVVAATSSPENSQITNTYLSCDTSITETFRNSDGYETKRDVSRKYLNLQIQEIKGSFFNIIVNGVGSGFNALSVKLEGETYLKHEATSDDYHYYVNSASGAKMPKSDEPIGVKFVEIYIDRVQGSMNFETKFSSRILGTSTTTGSGRCERANRSTPKF